MLKANPSWEITDWLRMVSNRFLSEGVNGERPRVWLPHISKYARGPLDLYGHPLTQPKQDGMCFRRGCRNIAASESSFCSDECEIQHRKALMGR